MQLFHTILFQPIYNILILFYDLIPGQDMGLAIIALTVLLKMVLFPFNWKAIQSQKAMNDIQPKLKELQVLYKDDKQKLAQETMRLYKEQKVNPFSSCLPLLIQLPIMIAVYQVFQAGLSSFDPSELYYFIPNPGSVNEISFGILNLAVPNYILAVLAGAAQFVQTKMMPIAKPVVKSEASKDEDLLASMNKSMIYAMPIMTIVIGITLPAGLTLYWLVTTLLTALQQLMVFRWNKKKEAPALPADPNK
jgi:YidC/Oxa1 family membrane protein insertase